MNKENLIKSGCLLSIKLPSEDGVTNDVDFKFVLYKEDYSSDEIILVDMNNDWFYVSTTLEIALANINAEILSVIQPEQYYITTTEHDTNVNIKSGDVIKVKYRDKEYNYLICEDDERYFLMDTSDYYLLGVYSESTVEEFLEGNDMELIEIIPCDPK